MNNERIQFIGVGVGPGDPGLITLKAADYVRTADVISFIEGSKGNSRARYIARELLDQSNVKVRELAILMPMCEDRSVANQAYDEGAVAIQNAINLGEQVVFLCEGDPLFFGSFTYLLSRLSHNRCEVVPGISSIHASSAALQLPLTLLQESFAVVSGRHSQHDIETALEQHDSVVIMKAGRARPKILDALKTTGRLHEATYCEYLGWDKELIQRKVADLADGPGPYFSLFVVTPQDREL